MDRCRYWLAAAVISGNDVTGNEDWSDWFPGSGHIGWRGALHVEPGEWYGYDHGPTIWYPRFE